MLPVDRPLVVDLDGTLLRSDLLVESFFSLLASRPVEALKAVFSLREGKAALKQRIAHAATLDIARLPWNDEVVDFIVAERQRGRKVYLATAADHSLADAVARELGLFDGVFASDGRTNLSGPRKAKILCETFGEGGFDYIGNEAVDIEVWEKAGGVLVANAPASFFEQVRARFPQARALGSRKMRVRTYLKAIRVHQWLKNLLVAVPAVAAHQVGMPEIGAIILAFFSFSLIASSVYVTNDLIDLGRDRAHSTKRNRPFAAGTIPVLHGLVMTPALLLCGILLALPVGLPFLGVLALYYAATLAYSTVLKRKMMLDVVVLAGLYGLRLLAGSVAVDIKLSAWLGAFALFIFTSLALVKRCAELIERSAAGLGNPSGRDYRLADLPMLAALAAASGFTAILVFALYVNSDAVRMAYDHPNRLWLICVVLVYWLGRVLMLTQRNEMHDDPVIFAATDRVSQVCAVLCGGILLASL
ncbi:UbiA family prenyltransferase [Roseomonas sp. NAR14]|uniref:UbiA family prenyltransferase n=1 Tax=Roseomonas acroporae TaxID=2937791 RepID=A0A9X2BV13_9PROT|nr:UbiA family prenyltransferase [Roseomonas acroporae]